MANDSPRLGRGREGDILTFDLVNDFGDGESDFLVGCSPEVSHSSGGVESVGAIVDISTAQADTVGIVHLEVEVGEIVAIGGAHGADLFPPGDQVTYRDLDGL